MKKLLSVLLAGIMVLTLAACGGGETKQPENNDKQGEEVTQTADFETLKAEFAAKTAEDLIAECFADRANPTVDEFAKLYENYAFVDADEEYAFGDNAIKEACKILKDEGVAVKNVRQPEIITYLMNSEYAGARAYMYREQSTNNIDPSAGIYAPLLEKGLSETEPFVVYNVLRGLPQSYGNNEAFWNYALPFVNSDDANVRTALAIAFDRFDMENKDATVEAALALMNDTDKSVKQHALNYAGNIGDDRLVDAYRAVLMDEAQAKDYHGNALLGLIKLWYGYPTHKNTSEAAYRLMMEYLTMDTTNPDIPSWNGMTGFKMKGAHYDEWRAAATYFDEREVVAAMLKIINDAEASKLVKNSAIDMIAAWGTVEDAQAAKSAAEALPDDNADKQSLIEKCDKAIEKF